MRARDLLNVADRMRIETAVQEAELGHSGEIVVVVVDACDEYGSAGWRFACVLAALALLGLGWLRPETTLAGLLGAQALALAAGHWLARRPALRRRLLPEPLVAQRVHERAMRAFAEHGLARTRGRTGVLLLLSALERRVVVLADEGVQRVLAPEERWEDVVALATAGLREGRAADGIVAAVRRCGEILARVVPQDGASPDELPRALVVEE